MVKNPASVIDLSAVSPKHQAEIAAMQNGGGYAGVRAGSLARWKPYAGSANADTIFDLQDLRAKCRDLNRNNPVACGATNTTVTRAIGTGLTMQPRIDRAFLGLSDDAADAWQADTRRRFEGWAESADCDAERRLNFYGLQACQMRSALESGDVFALLPSILRQGSDSTLAVQLVEADRVSLPPGRINNDRHTDGIDFDEHGAPVTVYITNRHPGDISNSTMLQWLPVPVFGAATGRRNVLHIFGTPETLRPSQARGVPLLAPVIEPLKQLSRFTEAELQAAVNGAMYSMFIEMESDAFQDLFDPEDKEKYIDNARKWKGSTTGGKAVNLLPGEKIHDVQPAHPNAGMDPFMAAILKQVGAALGLPFEVLILCFNASYSASRAALLAAWHMFRLRRENCATYFCQPIYEAWLYEQIAIGAIRAPGYRDSSALRKAWSAAHWIGDGPGSIDPQREVQAAQSRVDMGISTLDAESVAYDGLDWQEKHRQRVKEQQMRVDGKLVPPLPSKQPTGSP